MNPFADQNISLKDLFERQVAVTPGKTALVCGAKTLTFAELNARANGLAHHLIGLGVAPEDRVGLFVSRSIDMVVGLLGILKAGGAYLPLDPAYPRTRLNLMVHEAPIAVLLTDQPRESRPEITPATRVVDLSALAPEDGFQENPSVTPRPSNLAYVLFTSGSSGRPKGVAGCHGGIVNRLSWMWRAYPFAPHEVCCHKTTLSFVDSVWEVFGPLLAGVTLVIAEDETVGNPQLLVALLAKQRVSRLVLVPSLLRVMLNLFPDLGGRLPDLKIWISSGEALSGDVLQRFRALLPDRTLLNLYGSSEVAADVTCYDTGRFSSSPSPVPLGQAIDRMRVYIADGRLNPVAYGDPGEILVAGPGLARGYLGQAGLTAERFVPNPFAKQDGDAPDAVLIGDRLYKTGDMGRFLPTGDLEFLGRKDQQVKIRGVRIELGEIEQVLRQHEAVQECVVIARENPAGDARLVAYVRPESRDSGMDRTAANRIAQWQQVWDTTYLAPTEERALNLAGWRDSVSGNPLAADHMRQWVETTVARIGEHRPRRVLEIGCGTGLLLLRLAPHCAAYIASDISQRALAFVAEAMAATGGLQQVTLLERGADDFAGFEPDAFDTVILNSVVQYFPDIGYLLDVLEKALAVTAPGGRIFIGDIRNLKLLEVFHAALQLSRAPDHLTAAALLRQIGAAVAAERELLLDPALFPVLARHFPAIESVEVQLKRGRYHNEVSQYRYDVTLHVGPCRTERSPKASPVWRDWREEGLSLEAIRRILREESPPMLAVRRLPNARVFSDARILERLAEDERAFLGALRRQSAEQGVAPEDCWELGEELSYVTHVGWSREAGRMDVIWRRASLAPPDPDPLDRADRVGQWEEFANKPLQGRLNDQLMPELRLYLAEQLPEPMRPAALVLMDRFPLTPNGKIDRQRLPAPKSRPPLKTKLVAPHDQTQDRVAAIWQEALQLDVVGIYDNFFELGGHSLMLAEMYQKLVPLGPGLTLVDMLQYPTIHTLAQHLTRLARPDGEPRQGFNHPSTHAGRRMSENSGALRYGQGPTGGPGPMSQPGTSPNRTADIAIIGMACRFPGADDPQKFWENLCRGVESITFFSEAGSPDGRTQDGSAHVNAAARVEGVALFDADFFHYSAREARFMDPQQRLFLECAHEAFEDAGYAPGTHDGSVGIYAGSGLNTYLINQVHPHLDFSSQRSFLGSANDLFIRLGNDKDHLATRVAYKLNLKGPSVTVQTACSTSLVAVHLACQSLLSGACDMVLAGCMNLILPQENGYWPGENLIFSPDGHCRAFDARAQGTLFGSGGGAVVMKMLDRALADGDAIYAVIKGSAINNDGAGKLGYTASSVDGQAAVVFDALSNAKLDAGTITFVEAHGTGTPLGDPVEITALTRAFRANMAEQDVTAAERKFSRNRCAIGSVKTNVGHLTEASGMAGLIKTALALYHRQIPPTLHFEKPNPEIDFENSPFYVNTSLVDWVLPADLQAAKVPRRAGVSAFGMGGANAHVVLEEAPPRQDESAQNAATGDGWVLLPLSAKSPRALAHLARAYLDQSDACPQDISLADVCFTASLGRRHFSHRAALVVRSRAGLLANLAALAESETKRPSAFGLQTGQVEPQQMTAQNMPPSTRKIAFLFTGQGDQYAGMGRHLYENLPAFRRTIDRCDRLLQRHNGWSLIDVMLSPGVEERHFLDRTQFAQPALFALEYALAEQWQVWGVRPAVLCGHGAGEYVAACLAGVFSLDEALWLVAERGRLMEASLCKGIMAGVFASEAVVAEAIRPLANTVSIAAVNGPESVVISGDAGDVQKILADLNRRDIKTQRHASGYAFHSPLIDPLLHEFNLALARISFKAPRLPLFSNLTGRLAGPEMATAAYWCEHMRQPVRFADSIAACGEMQADVFVELGPKPTLLSLGCQNLPGDPCLWLASLHPGRQETPQMLSSLGALYVHGLEVDWSGVQEEGGATVRRQRVHLPTYPFQRERHWIDGAHGAHPIPNPSGSQRTHPLLGSQMLLAGTSEKRFECRSDRTCPELLSGYRNDGRALFSFAAGLEMALAACVEGANDGANRFRPMLVEDLAMGQPLFLQERLAKVLQTTLAPEADGPAGRNAFAIYCRHRGGAEPGWSSLCSGRVSALDSAPFAAANEPGLAWAKAQCTASMVVSRRDESLRDHGVADDSRAGILEHLWRSPDLSNPALLAKFHLDDRDADPYLCHPAFMEACGRLLLMLVPPRPSQWMIPHKIKRFAFGASLAKESWVFARMQPGDLSGNPTLDLTIYDRNGVRLASLTGLEWRTVDRCSAEYATRPDAAVAIAIADRADLQGPAEPNILNRLTGAPLRQRRDILIREIKTIADEALGTSDGSLSETALRQGFIDAGMDSFTSITMQNQLQIRLNCKLEPTIVFDHPSVAELAAYLETVLPVEFDEKPGVGPSLPLEEAGLDLFPVLAALSESQAEALLLEQLEGFEE